MQMNDDVEVVFDRVAQVAAVFAAIATLGMAAGAVDVAMAAAF